MRVKRRKLIESICIIHVEMIVNVSPPNLNVVKYLIINILNYK